MNNCIECGAKLNRFEGGEDRCFYHYEMMLKKRREASNLNKKDGV